MKVDFICGGVRYQGEVVEGAVQNLVEQGLRYYMLNKSGGKNKGEVFNEKRLGLGGKVGSEVLKQKDEEIEALKQKLKELGGQA